MGTSGGFRTAYACFSKAIEVRPDLVRSYGMMAGFLFRQGRCEEALTFDRKSVDLAPDDATGRHNLSRTLMCLDRNADAEVELRRAIDLDPKLADARAALGVLLLKRRDLREARQHLELAVELAPDDPASRADLARTCFELGEWQAAIDQYRAVVKLEPGRAANRRNLAHVHSHVAGVCRAQERLKDALAHYQAAVECDPTWGAAHLGMAKTLAAQGLAGPARQHFALAERYAPRLVALSKKSGGRAVFPPGEESDGSGPGENTPRIGPPENGS